MLELAMLASLSSISVDKLKDKIAINEKTSEKFNFNFLNIGLTPIPRVSFNVIL